MSQNNKRSHKKSTLLEMLIKEQIQNLLEQTPNTTAPSTDSSTTDFGNDSGNIGNAPAAAGDADPFGDVASGLDTASADAAPGADGDAGLDMGMDAGVGGSGGTGDSGGDLGTDGLAGGGDVGGMGGGGFPSGGGGGFSGGMDDSGPGEIPADQQDQPDQNLSAELSEDPYGFITTKALEIAENQSEIKPQLIVNYLKYMVQNAFSSYEEAMPLIDQLTQTNNPALIDAAKRLKSFIET